MIDYPSANFNSALDITLAVKHHESNIPVLLMMGAFFVIWVSGIIYLSQCSN